MTTLARSRALAVALCAVLLAPSVPAWSSDKGRSEPPRDRADRVRLETHLGDAPMDAEPKIASELESPEGLTAEGLSDVRLVLQPTLERDAATSGALTAPAHGLDIPPAGGEFTAAGARDSERLEIQVRRHSHERGFADEERPAEIAGDPARAQDARAPLAPAPLVLAASDGSLPAPKPSSDKPASIWAPRVLGFFSGYVLIQVAVEFLGVVVPQLTDPIAQGLLPACLIAAASYAFYAAGSYTGGRLVARFGIGPVYRSALFLRVAIAAALAFQYAHDQSMLSPLFLALLGSLYSLELFVHSTGRVAENTLRVAWFQGNTVASGKFASFRDFVEFGMVFFALATGPLIQNWGFGSVVYAVPVMFAVAAAVSCFLKLPPGKAEKANPLAGFKALFRDPGLLKPFLGLLLFGNFFYPFYHVTSTAFALYASHGSIGALALIASTLIGSYGLGGILGAVVMARIFARLDKRTAAIADEDEREKEKLAMLTRNASPVLKWAAAALIGAWLFTLHSELTTVSIGAIAASWPVFWIMPALVFIGMTAQLVSIHLDTIMADRIPKSMKANIVGASRTVPYLTYALNYLMLGVAFYFLGAHAFIFLGIYATLSALGYLWLSKPGRI